MLFNTYAFASTRLSAEADRNLLRQISRGDHFRLLGIAFYGRCMDLGAITREMSRDFPDFKFIRIPRLAISAGGCVGLPCTLYPGTNLDWRSREIA